MESPPNLAVFTTNGPDQKIPRATTFPTTMATQMAFQQCTASDPNLHQSYMGNRKDISGAGTPESSSTTNSLQTNLNYPPPQQQQVLPDLTAMMFPSTDPFAYPNQPMIELDNIQQKREPVDDVIGDQPQNLFMIGGDVNNPGPYDNLEGQLFGPLPPYLLQSQANENLRAAPGYLDLSGLNGFTNPALDVAGLHSGLTPNGGAMNFDEIFNNIEWNDYRQGA